MRTTEPRNRWILVAAALVLIASIAVFLLTRDGTDNRSPNSPSISGKAKMSSSDRVAPAAAPPDGVVLPDGAREVDGRPIEFPYTDLGAVAVQAAVAQAQVGFNYDEAVEIAGVYAAAADRMIFEARARSAVALRRKQANVSAHGQVPAPASYAATPVAYTLAELGTDYYAVNLLSYITLTTTAGAIADGLYAGTQLVRWVDGDWKLVQGSREEVKRLIDQGQPKAAAPGTAEFRQAGWIQINGAAR